MRQHMTQITATYIDHMRIRPFNVVNAARVSFGKKSDWDHTPCPDSPNMPTEIVSEDKKLTHKDTKLIRYLAKHKHLSPFGHAFASFHVKAPIFVARQLGQA
jgi:thymidylate synthase (FAD)